MNVHSVRLKTLYFRSKCIAGIWLMFAHWEASFNFQFSSLFSCFDVDRIFLIVFFSDCFGFSLIVLRWKSDGFHSDSCVFLFSNATPWSSFCNEVNPRKGEREGCFDMALLMSDCFGSMKPQLVLQIGLHLTLCGHVVQFHLKVPREQSIQLKSIGKIQVKCSNLCRTSDLFARSTVIIDMKRVFIQDWWDRSLFPKNFHCSSSLSIVVKSTFKSIQCFCWSIQPNAIVSKAIDVSQQWMS